MTSPFVIEHAMVRREISQYSAFRVGLRIADRTGPRDAVDGSVWVRVYRDTDDVDPEKLVLELSQADGVEREDVGVYAAVLLPEYTAELGWLLIEWEYRVPGSTVQKYQEHYRVSLPMPYYDALTPSEQFVVEQVNWMIGDLFDSTEGGPHLVEEYQSRFGYDRLAQLLAIAVNRINITSRPLTDFKVGQINTEGFPPQFHSVLVLALYVELIRHLIRSYVEQPLIQGGPGVAYTDRRDYIERWRSVLRDEEADLKAAIRTLKRKQLNLGTGSMIVSGGIYGRHNQFRSGSYATSTRAMRFYPMTWVGVQR